MTLCITTFCIMTLSIMTLRIMTLSIMRLIIMTLSIMAPSVITLSIMTLNIMAFSITTLSITKNHSIILSILVFLLRLCGLYYKHNMIVNDDSSIANKFEALLTEDNRILIYDHHMFIE